MADRKRMTVKEFREQGYLQELNRRFLHLVGLALEVVVAEDGSESFGQVWDVRDDPEGIIFSEEEWGEPEAVRGRRIMGEIDAKSAARHRMFGWGTQPLRK